LFISTAKFAKHLLCYPKHLYISETHTNMQYTLFLYTHVLDGAGIETRRK